MNNYQFFCCPSYHTLFSCNPDTQYCVHCGAEVTAQFANAVERNPSRHYLLMMKDHLIETSLSSAVPCATSSFDNISSGTANVMAMAACSIAKSASTETDKKTGGRVLLLPVFFPN